MESNLFIFKMHGTQALPLDDTVWSQLTTIITIQIILFYTKFVCVCVCSYWPSHCQHFSSNSQFLWLSLYWLAHENSQQNHHDFVFVGESTHTHTMYRLHKRPNYLNKALCVWLWLLVKEMSGKESQPLTKENLIELENLPMKHVSRKSYGCQVRDSDRIPIEVVLSLTVVLVIFSFWWLWSEESAYTRCVFVHTALSDV